MDLGSNTASYVGGQMEIVNSEKRHLYRGDIGAIVVEGKKLRVTLDWIAEREWLSPSLHKWVQTDKRKDYIYDLKEYRATDMGIGRTYLTIPNGEGIIILHPLGGNRICPAEVKGLNIQKRAPLS